MNTLIGTLALLMMGGTPAYTASSVAPNLEPLPVVKMVRRADTVDLAERTKVIDNLIKAISERYVDVAIAKKISSMLGDWKKSDEFKSLDDVEAFTARTNEIMKALVTDAHLRFRYSKEVQPERKEADRPSADEEKKMKEWVRSTNALFKKVEVLPGNIGYFAFDFFASGKEVGQRMAGVMRFLQNTDAMIIDLRTNGGGDPDGVRMVCSYFFDSKPVHLNDIYMREGNQTEEFWTLKSVDGPRYLNKPVYILVSKRTGSGAEECSYDFQTQRRATIVGEPTWGGANPGGSVRLGDHFNCFIPVGKAINPITKTNWEGTGVIPDVKADPSTSLATVQKMILESFLAKSKDDETKAQYERLIEGLSTKG